MSETNSTEDRLRLHIEAIERLEEDKKGVADDISERYSMAKAEGYDTKVMKVIVKLRRMRPDDRREMDMIVDTYKHALGID